MKLFAYEVRDDERDYFEALQKELNIEIYLYEGILDHESIHLCEGYDAITTLGQSTIDHSILEELSQTSVGVLTTRTIGYNHIDLEAARKYGISVANASYPPNGVAEYAIMLMLLLLRNYKPALWRIQVNDYSLNGLQGKELRQMTVGVIGTGKIGACVIQYLQSFGCKLLAYDPYPKEGLSAKYVSLDEIYQQCDIITLHSPLNDSTYHMIDSSSIEKMKDGVILINCARGELIDTDSVIDGIESEKIGGLGLDVIENETGIYHLDLRSDIIKNRDMAYLRQFPNVVTTQHMAFYTDEAVKSMVEYGVKGAIALTNHLDFETKLV